MDPDKIIDGLFKELGGALKALSTAKTAQDKVAYSEVVRNLSESVGIFLDLANGMMECECEE